MRTVTLRTNRHQRAWELNLAPADRVRRPYIATFRHADSYCPRLQLGRSLSVKPVVVTTFILNSGCVSIPATIPVQKAFKVEKGLAVQECSGHHNILTIMRCSDNEWHKMSESRNEWFPLFYFCSCIFKTAQRLKQLSHPKVDQGMFISTVESHSAFT